MWLMGGVIRLCEDGTVDPYSLFLASMYRAHILVSVAIVTWLVSDVRIDVDHRFGCVRPPFMRLRIRGDIECASFG
jgi:hypothetical protein